MRNPSHGLGHSGEEGEQGGAVAEALRLVDGEDHLSVGDGLLDVRAKSMNSG
jgi:hypothetical protein